MIREGAGPVRSAPASLSAHPFRIEDGIFLFWNRRAKWLYLGDMTGELIKLEGLLKAQSRMGSTAPPHFGIDCGEPLRFKPQSLIYRQSQVAFNSPAIL